MTRSFTSMLLTLQALAAVVIGDSGFLDSLSLMAQDVAPLLPTLPEKLRHLFLIMILMITCISARGRFTVWLVKAR